jgi:hypothetical protein
LSGVTAMAFSDDCAIPKAVPRRKKVAIRNRQARLLLMSVSLPV